MVLHDTDGHGAVMQQDEPCPACLICMQHMWSAWPHARAVWAARTLQHLDPDGIFVAHAGLVALTAHPVIPACDIVEAHVELVVLEVALGHEAHMAGGRARGMAGGLDEVVEADCAGASGGACGLVLICSSDGAASGVIGSGMDKGAIMDEGDVMNEGHVMNEKGVS